MEGTPRVTLTVGNKTATLAVSRGNPALADSLNGKALVLHTNAGGSIPSSATSRRGRTMNDRSLFLEIMKDADCLWQISDRIRKGQQLPTDCEEGQACYSRLERNLAEYLEERSNSSDNAEIWFALTVVDAFSDIHRRFVS